MTAPSQRAPSSYASNQTPSRWLQSVAAYTEAAPWASSGTWGRQIRLQGPGIFNIDFELHKQFRMPYNEHHALQFRFEAFNVLNHPNWGMPNLNILSGPVFAGQPGTNGHQGFGVISGTQTSMRQIQLGLKYSF